MMKHKGAIGNLWGYKPLNALYIWRGIVRPMVSFGCLIWNPVLRLKSAIEELRKLQSLSFQLICFYRRKSPRKGLEIITHTLPAHLFMFRTAAKAYFRTTEFAPYNDDEMWTNKETLIGHRQWISYKIQEHGLDYIKGPSDAISVERVWNKSYKVDLATMDKQNPLCGKPLYVNPWQIYTDGSKQDETKDYACGASVVPFIGGQPYGTEIAMHLGNRLNVYLCEVYALFRAVRWILDHWEMIGDDGVSIFTDSQAVVLALSNNTIKSQLVMKTYRLLERVCDMTNISNITIHWIKGHAGHSGNVRADEAANLGALDVSLMVRDLPALPKSEVHQAINRITYTMWRNVWTAETNECRQTRLWFPHGPRPRFSYSLLRLPRVACGQMIQFLTGHNYLKRHQAIIDKTDCKICTFCGKGEESTEHIMSYCDAFATLRQLTFNDPYPAPPYDNLQFEQVVNFLKFAKINTLELFSSIRELLEARHPEWLSDSEYDEDDD